MTTCRRPYRLLLSSECWWQYSRPRFVLIRQYNLQDSSRIGNERFRSHLQSSSANTVGILLKRDDTSTKAFQSADYTFLCHRTDYNTSVILHYLPNTAVDSGCILCSLSDRRRHFEDGAIFQLAYSGRCSSCSTILATASC